MQRILIMVAVVLMFSLTAFASKNEASAPKIDETSVISVKNMTIEEQILRAAQQFGQSPQLISKISWCESGHKVLPHDGGQGVNMTGIWDDTFRGWLPLYEKETGESLDINSTYDQFKMMSWAFSKGESYRRQWTTYRAYSNGGTYTFNYKGKPFTSRCK